jgi:hypothetical protein
MAHFYGLRQGSRGEATRMGLGSKDSGYLAWAQNGTSQVRVQFFFNEFAQRDLVDITLGPSTISYGSGRITLAHDLDVDALRGANHIDAATTKHLNAAIQSLEKANVAAQNFQKKVDKQKEKARA